MKKTNRMADFSETCSTYQWKVEYGGNLDIALYTNGYVLTNFYDVEYIEFVLDKNKRLLLIWIKESTKLSRTCLSMHKYVKNVKLVNLHL